MYRVLATHTDHSTGGENFTLALAQFLASEFKKYVIINWFCVIVCALVCLFLYLSLVCFCVASFHCPCFLSSVIRFSVMNLECFSSLIISLSLCLFHCVCCCAICLSFFVRFRAIYNFVPLNILVWNCSVQLAEGGTNPVSLWLKLSLHCLGSCYDHFTRLLKKCVRACE